MTLTEPRLRTLRNIRDKGIPYASQAVTRELKRAGLCMQDDDRWWLTEAGHAALAGVESGERLVADALKVEGT